MLPSTARQRAGHDSVTEQQQGCDEGRDGSGARTTRRAPVSQRRRPYTAGCPDLHFRPEPSKALLLWPVPQTPGPAQGSEKTAFCFPLKLAPHPPAPQLGVPSPLSHPLQALIWVPAPTPTGLFPTLLQKTACILTTPIPLHITMLVFFLNSALRFVKTNYECVYSNFYKCVYSNFYKCVYSDFINVFNLILSVITSRPLTLWT